MAVWKETWETPEWARARPDALERIAIALERIAAAEEGRIASIRRLEERQDRLDAMAEDMEHALAEEQMEGERCMRYFETLSHGAILYHADSGAEHVVSVEGFLPSERPLTVMEIAGLVRGCVEESAGERVHDAYIPVAQALRTLEEEGRAHTERREGGFSRWSKP